MSIYEYTQRVYRIICSQVPFRLPPAGLSELVTNLQRVQAQGSCKMLLKGRAGNSLICSSLIHSFRSNQMSECERFTQIAPPSPPHGVGGGGGGMRVKWQVSSTSHTLTLISPFLVSDVSESLRSLTKNERCEQIAQVTHQK